MWYSHAKWPLDTYSGEYGDGISVDKHDTREQAVGVCIGLTLEGFGGQRQSFPIITWVAEKETRTPPSGATHD